MDAALSHLPAVHLRTDQARQLCHGQTIQVSVSAYEEADAPDTASAGVAAGGRTPAEMDLYLVRAYGPDARLLAVAQADPLSGLLRPRKVFCAPEGHHECA
jgi:hypothetical protein